VKLLFDQNLAPSLAQRLEELFPGSSHVRLVGLERAADSEIWEYARSRAFVIVTKDWDFHQLSFLHGAPPQVVWIRKGNCSVEDIEQILRSNAQNIMEFERDEEATLLALS
jgi:predicted nuclease of predicted toxin-antitoxin system